MTPYFETKNGKLYHGDCLQVMKELGIKTDLTVSSPPYYNLKSYSSWNSYDLYLQDVTSWFEILFESTLQGRYVCWNIQDNLPEYQNKHRHYYALMPDTIKIAQNIGFEWETNIIWNKQNATQVMLGSYPYPPTMIYMQMTESICIFRKPGKALLREKNEKDKLSKSEWSGMIRNVWNISAQTKSLHPAPFPLQIPDRLVKLHSLVGDLVIDPFFGSGTTGVACELLDRRWIGIEQDETYCSIAAKRIKEASKQFSLFKGK